MLHESETWTMRKEDIKKQKVFEMWTWRSMENVNWTEHIITGEVLKMIGGERNERNLMPIKGKTDGMQSIANVNSRFLQRPQK